MTWYPPPCRRYTRINTNTCSQAYSPQLGLLKKVTAHAAFRIMKFTSTQGRDIDNTITARDDATSRVSAEVDQPCSRMLRLDRPYNHGACCSHAPRARFIRYTPASQCTTSSMKFAARAHGESIPKRNILNLRLSQYLANTGVQNADLLQAVLFTYFAEHML